MLDRKAQEILGLQFPEKPEDREDYLLTMQSVIESQEFLEEMQREQNRETHPLVTEAKKQLRTAINAASGMRKIIEQLHSHNATVKIASHEKNVKRAIKRVYKTGADEITFEMYKQAIERTREIADEIRKGIIDEQAKRVQE
jgi:hypothetical protein